MVAGIGILQWIGVPIAEGLGGPVTLNMGNANFAAAYAGITAAVSAGVALWPEVPRIWRLVAAGLSITLAALSFATGSLQGPLTAVVGVWVVLGLSARLRLGKLSHWLTIVWLAMSGVALALVALSLLGIGPVSTLWEQDTFAIRIEYWRTALAMAEGLPIFGSGPDGFARYLGELRPESYVEILGPANNVSAAHNVALNWAATLGLPALALWLVGVIAVLWVVLRLALTGATEEGPGLLPCIAGGFVAYLAQGMVSIDMIPLLSLGWALVGLIVALLLSSRVEAFGEPRAKPTQAASRLVLIFGAVAALAAASVATLQVAKVDSIRSVSTSEAAIGFMLAPLVPCDARRDMTEQVVVQLPIEQSVSATITASRLDPRCPYMVNIEADATIKVRAMDDAAVAVDEGARFDPLYDVAWVLKARRDLVVGDLEAARASASEAERVQDLYPESQRDFGLIRNLYADIDSLAPVSG